MKLISNKVTYELEGFCIRTDKWAGCLVHDKPITSLREAQDLLKDLQTSLIDEEIGYSQFRIVRVETKREG